MKSKNFWLILLLMITAACEKPFFAKSVKSFWVENASDHLIMTLRSYQYPDTTIPDKERELGGISKNVRAPYDFNIKDWPELFEQLPQDTLSVFIFHGDTIAKYSWQEIRSGYKILKRYDLSQKDLENANSIIRYP